MNLFELPTSLNFGGVDWNIRTDFRAILDILKYFSDPEYENDEKWEICLDILYEDYADMPYELKEEACKKATEFIDMGINENGIRRPVTMDWEQDAPIIIPSINRVLGTEVRAASYLHWWTFLCAYMEIGESLFSEVINIRSKKAKRKKLNDMEAEFYRENKEMIDLKKKYTEEEKAEQEMLMAQFD